MSRFARQSLALLLAVLLGAAPAFSQTELDTDLFGKSLEAAKEALRVYGTWDEPTELQRVASIGYRVAAESGFDGFPISFYLINMPEPNAFALPAGQVFVTRGMLSIGLTDDELAALLGHEIAHVVKGHGLKMQRRATLLNVLTQALMVGVMVSANKNGGQKPGEVPDPYGIERSDSGQGDLVYGTYAAGLILSELLLRSYSRDFEDEADEEGQRWAASAGFSPTGTVDLMTALGSRLPDASKEYGYWRTHPFFEERVAAARIRAQGLSRGDEKDPRDFRSQTQQTLLAYAASTEAEARKELDKGSPRDRSRPQAPPRERAQAPIRGRDLVEQAALTAWPRGIEAERLRLDRIHAVRDRELSQQPLARDYGKLLHEYDAEIAEIRVADPDSTLVERLGGEREGLVEQCALYYPKAVDVWKRGIWETPFLETFLSNWPDAAESADVALALGEAYARSARQADAVALFLKAWDAAPESEAARRAQRGLRNLAPGLNQLTALAELADQRRDPELGQLAAARLGQLAKSYDDIAAGAAYLSRFPEGSYVDDVRARLNVLAENLYGEVVLYQGIGDHVKAIDRIQKILTHAPASPAAMKLLDRLVLPT